MDTTKATAATVEAARIAAGMTRLALSEASGIPRASLYRLLDGHASWNVDQLHRVGTALGVDPSTLPRFEAVTA